MRALAALALLCLALGGLHAQAQAESWGVSPGVVQVNAAQPGQSYVARVQLQNQFVTEARVTVERSGAAGNWTTLDVPASFTVPARGTRQVTLTIAVPAAQGPGPVQGQVTFHREPDATPSTSGASVRQGAGVLLRLEVGGQAVERVTWSAPRAEDAAQGADVHAYATARNEGNVLATARLAGEVLPFTGDGALRNATGALSLRPGEQAEVQVTFPAGLPVGQYRVRLRADGLDETLPFKVTPPGAAAPDGLLKALLHPARATAGQPVRIDAWFQNTGGEPIRAAAFRGEVRRDGALVAPLGSDALAVAPGQSANLTAYWTPPSPGTYTLAGAVLYDGYLTTESHSLLTVEPANAEWPWWLWLVAGGALAVALLVAFALKRGERRRKATTRGP